MQKSIFFSERALFKVLKVHTKVFVRKKLRSNIFFFPRYIIACDISIFSHYFVEWSVFYLILKRIILKTSHPQLALHLYQTLLQPFPQFHYSLPVALEIGPCHARFLRQKYCYLVVHFCCYIGYYG